MCRVIQIKCGDDDEIITKVCVKDTTREQFAKAKETFYRMLEEASKESEEELCVEDYYYFLTSALNECGIEFSTVLNYTWIV